MLLETNNLVSAEMFRQDLDKYVAAARKGRGPIAVTQNSEVVGFFVGAAEYEAMVSAAVRKLLKSRAKGPTITHEEVNSRIRQVTRRRSRKP